MNKEDIWTISKTISSREPRLLYRVPKSAIQIKTHGNHFFMVVLGFLGLNPPPHYFTTLTEFHDVNDSSFVQIIKKVNYYWWVLTLMWAHSFSHLVHCNGDWSLVYYLKIQTMVSENVQTKWTQWWDTIVIRYDDHQWYQSQSARRNFHHLKVETVLQKFQYIFSKYLPLGRLLASLWLTSNEGWGTFPNTISWTSDTLTWKWWWEMGKQLTQRKKVEMSFRRNNKCKQCRSFF